MKPGSLSPELPGRRRSLEWSLFGLAEPESFPNACPQSLGAPAKVFIDQGIVFGRPTTFVVSIMKMALRGFPVLILGNPNVSDMGRLKSAVEL